MTTSRKILFACLLLGGGYGLAVLLGEIDRPGWFPNLLRGTGNSAPTTAAQLSPQFPMVPAEPTTLVPAAAAQPQSPAPPLINAVAASWQPAEQPKWLAADQSQSTPTGASPSGASAPELVAPSLTPDGNPRARITNVTPSSEPVAAASSPWDRWPPWEPNAAPAVASNNVDPSSTPPRETIAPTQYQSANPPSTGAMQAAFEQPRTPSAGMTPIAGAPVRAPGDPHELRTHIVIDGDSLSTLAGRYLHDPQLGDEIFRLNRDVLTTPELLPIGVELKIPDNRVAVTSTIPGAPRSDATAAVTTPAPPVRLPEVTKDTAATPRAQILRPVAASSAAAGS